MFFGKTNEINISNETILKILGFIMVGTGRQNTF